MCFIFCSFSVDLAHLKTVWFFFCVEIAFSRHACPTEDFIIIIVIVTIVNIFNMAKNYCKDHVCLDSVDEW